MNVRGGEPSSGWTWMLSVPFLRTIYAIPEPSGVNAIEPVCSSGTSISRGSDAPGVMIISARLRRPPVGRIARNATCLPSGDQSRLLMLGRGAAVRLGPPLVRIRKICDEV